MRFMGDSIFTWIFFGLLLVPAGVIANNLTEQEMKGKVFITSAEPGAMDKIRSNYFMKFFSLSLLRNWLLSVFYIKRINGQQIIGSGLLVLLLGLLVSFC